MPITPGVVLLDEAIYAIAQHAQLNVDRCKINSIKFLNPVLPDTKLTLQYEIRANGNTYFDILDVADTTNLNESRRIMATGVFSV